MDTIIQTITGSPSHILEKSATRFGETSSRVIAQCIEESIEKVSHDLSGKVDEVGKSIDKTFTMSVSSFGDTFEKSMTDGFGEWGLSIERAFGHLGEKTQTGLVNSFHRLSNALEISLKASNKQIVVAINQGFRKLTRIGVSQMEEARRIYFWEVRIILLCCLLISLGVFMFGLGYLSAMPIFEIITFLFVDQFRVVVFFAFALLLGYGFFIYHQTEQLRLLHLTEKVKKLRKGKKSKNLSKVDREKKSNDSLHLLEKERNREGTRILIILIGFGFVSGNLSVNLFPMGTYSFLLSFIILLLISSLVFQLFHRRFLFSFYSFYRTIQEFMAWRKNKNELIDSLVEKRRLQEAHNLRFGKYDEEEEEEEDSEEDIEELNDKKEKLNDINDVDIIDEDVDVDEEEEEEEEGEEEGEDDDIEGTVENLNFSQSSSSPSPSPSPSKEEIENQFELRKRNLEDLKNSENAI